MGQDPEVFDAHRSLPTRPPDLIAARMHDKCARAAKFTTQMDHTSTYQIIRVVNVIAAACLSEMGDGGTGP